MSEETRNQVKAAALGVMAFALGWCVLACLGCAAGAAGKAKVFNRELDTGAGFYLEGIREDVGEH